jgi:hypothetical protein
MRITKSLYGQRNGPLGIGPQFVFAAAISASVAFWIGLTTTPPTDFVLPWVATLLLVLAASLAVVAWRRHSQDPTRVTYADVAGALVLIGLCVAATIDPDPMVRIIDSDSRSR